MVPSQVSGKVLRGGELGGRVVQAEEISSMNRVSNRHKQSRSSGEPKSEQENHRGALENETVCNYVVEMTNTTQIKR